jgi:crotonobetainyl-CoA:carnitine CoA-transferase CaiB-like acyl-CoA transferase
VHDTGASAFLRGLVVLELGDGLAGAAATATLHDLGASVTTVLDPAASHRLGRPMMPGPDGPTSLLASIIDDGKRVLRPGPLALSGLEEIVSAGAEGRPFDLVVMDRIGGAPYGLEELGACHDYSRWVDRHIGSAWVTVSAFGLSGPRCEDSATELTLGAASGVLSAVRDPESGTPMKLGGQQVLLSAAQAAALAGCHAVDLSRSGDSVHLEVSAQETGIATVPLLAVTHLLLGCRGQFGEKRYGAPAGFFECNDGLIRISAMEDHQWQALVRAMGAPAWTERFASTEERINHPRDVDERLREWTAGQGKDELESRLQSEGVPATAMRTPHEILENRQLRHRASLEERRLGTDTTVRTVTSLPKAAVVASPESGRPRPARSIRGLRVFEFSHVLAVPLAGALLGAMGASVTKLEDPNRIDMYRRRGPYVDDVSGPNRGAYFAMVNHSKGSAVVDLERRDTLDQILASADVVIENLGTRTAKRYGIDSVSLSRSLPGVLCLSASGFGHTGPMAEYRAYAYNLQSTYGLSYLTRNSEGRPASMDHAWADLISGYAMATIVAAWAIGEPGNTGSGIDFAMGELIAARFNEFLAAASIHPGDDYAGDRANDSYPYAPNGVYAALDGWVALSVRSDEEFHRLVTALGTPDPLRMAEYAKAERRWEDRRRLDEMVSASLFDQPVTQAVTRLRSHGVLAEEVLSPTDLVQDEHLIERRYFAVVDHPEFGLKRLAGLPWRRAGEDPFPLGAPPLLDPGKPLRPPS